MKKAALLTIIIAIFLVSAPLYAQVYSYLDENGIRVITNIAPAGPVNDLNVSGRPLPPPEPKPVPKPGSAKLQSTAANRGSGAAPQKPGSSSTQTKANPYDAIINKSAAEFSLDPKLLHAMIATESGFNPRAVSPKGAQGLMQLMPATAARLGVNNPFDPEENISGGARYMRFLLDTFAEPAENALILSLAAYNAGENLVQSLGRVPNIRETNDYISSIIQRYGKRVMAASPPAVPAISAPRTYQYFDEKGILILTNIPPVDRSRIVNQTGVSNLISR